MEQRILVDGVVYFPFTPQSEQELEDAVIEHSELIFGKSSFFLPKKKLKTPAGIGSIPDGFVLDFKKGCWYVVEVELASHDVFSHIVPQVNKFLQATEDISQRMKLANEFYKWFKSEPVRTAQAKLLIGQKELFKSIVDVISKPPTVVVIIDEKTREVAEALKAIPGNKISLEFRTFVRQNVGDMRVHLHLIETLGTAKPSVGGEKKIAQPSGAKRSYLSFEELEQIAEDNGVGRLYNLLFEGLREIFGKTPWRTKSNVSFKAHFERGQRALLNINPVKSARDSGLYVEVYKNNLAEYLNIEVSRLRRMLPASFEDWALTPNAGADYEGYSGFFENEEDIRSFLSKLKANIPNEEGKKEGQSKPSVRGKIISQKEYYIPILEALVELGGSGKVREVLNIIHRKMKDRFSPLDLEPVPSGKDIRWESTVKWARNWLREQGYISSDSPWGVWEITDKGREYLRSKNNN